MTNAIGISLSGLKAASLRMEVSANNIANAQTTSKTGGPYIPQDVVQVNQANGGTLAYAKNSDRAPLSSFDFRTGEQIQLPDIDLAEEIGNQLEARSSFMANLKAIENQKSLLDSLTDMFA